MFGWPRCHALTAILLLNVAIPAVPAASAALPEQKIEVSGNERTRTNHILHLVHRCLSDDADRGQVSSNAGLRQCLLNTQLFTDVAVSIQNPNITVQVEERWTLIPIPFAQSDSDGNSSAGLFVLESNFMGNGQLAVAGFTMSNRGNSYIAFLQDKNLWQSRWMASLFATDATQQVPFYPIHQQQTDGFKENKTGGGFSLGYAFTEDSSLTVEARREHAGYQTYEDYTLRPQARDAAALGLRMRLGKTDYKLFFQEGATLDVMHNRQIMRTGGEKPATQTIAVGTIAMGVHGTHAVKLSLLAGRAGGGDVADLFRLGGRPGFRGIPVTGVWAEAYGAATTEYLMPVHQADYGVWTVSGFLEQGRLQAWRHGADGMGNYSTYGVGGYLFLKRIAIPGVGLELGHNSRYQTYFTTVSFGLSL